MVNHRVYDAFGNLVSETNTTKDYLFGYTGKAFDEETGLQNNLNRWYDPAVGRWLSEDPIRFAAGDANLSRYVGNAVTGATDPTGLDRKLTVNFGHTSICVDTYDTNGEKNGELNLHFSPEGYTSYPFGLPGDIAISTIPSTQAQDEALADAWRHPQDEYNDNKLSWYNPVNNCWFQTALFLEYPLPTFPPGARGHGGQYYPSYPPGYIPNPSYPGSSGGRGKSGDKSGL